MVSAAAFLIAPTRLRRVYVTPSTTRLTDEVRLTQ